MVDTRSNMQLSDLKNRPHGGKSLRNLIYRAMGACLYPPPVSVHYKLPLLYQFHVTSHIHSEGKKKSDIKMTKTCDTCNLTKEPRASQI